MNYYPDIGAAGAVSRSLQPTLSVLVVLLVVVAAVAFQTEGDRRSPPIGRAPALAA
jgi:hypothetical protein